MGQLSSGPQASSAQVHSRLAEHLSMEHHNQNKRATFWRAAAAQAPGTLALRGRHKWGCVMASRVQGATGAWRASELMRACPMRGCLPALCTCMLGARKGSRAIGAGLFLAGVGVQETRRACL